MNKIVLVIPVFGNVQITHQCLTSMFKYVEVNPAFDVVTIDDSTDELTKHCLKSYPVKVLTNVENKGYMYSINKGINYALNELSAEYIGLMNNDLEFNGPWLTEMNRYTKQFDIVSYFGRIVLYKKQCVETLHVEFSCALINRKVFEAIGKLDPIYKSGYYSDDDFCLRALLKKFRIGQINKGIPAKVHHAKGASYGSEGRFLRMQEEYGIFMERWGQRRNIPVVNEYFKKMSFNPFTKMTGEQGKWRIFLRKHILKKK